MTDLAFYLFALISFGIYFIIYTYYVPLKTQQKIESWLKSSESDKTLLMSLDVITEKIREQMLIDFEEFMIPQAKKAAIDFWNGAMGNAAKELGKTEEGAQFSIMHSMAKELENQPWYVQMLSSKLIPLINKAAEANQGDAPSTALKGLGLRK